MIPLIWFEHISVNVHLCIKLPLTKHLFNVTTYMNYVTCVQAFLNKGYVYKVTMS